MSDEPFDWKWAANVLDWDASKKRTLVRISRTIQPLIELIDIQSDVIDPLKKQKRDAFQTFARYLHAMASSCHNTEHLRATLTALCIDSTYTVLRDTVNSFCSMNNGMLALLMAARIASLDERDHSMVPSKLLDLANGIPRHIELVQAGHKLEARYTFECLDWLLGANVHNLDQSAMWPLNTLDPQQSMKLFMARERSAVALDVLLATTVPGIEPLPEWIVAWLLEAWVYGNLEYLSMHQALLGRSQRQPH